MNAHAQSARCQPSFCWIAHMAHTAVYDGLDGQRFTICTVNDGVPVCQEFQRKVHFDGEHIDRLSKRHRRSINVNSFICLRSLSAFPGTLAPRIVRGRGRSDSCRFAPFRVEIEWSARCQEWRRRSGKLTWVVFNSCSVSALLRAERLSQASHTCSHGKFHHT